MVITLKFLLFLLYDDFKKFLKSICNIIQKSLSKLSQEKQVIRKEEKKSRRKRERKNKIKEGVNKWNNKKT